MIHLHNLGLDAALFKLPNQIHGRAAAAQNGHGTHLLLAMAQAVQHFLQMSLGTDHI